tara:strand:+ start:164 stop:1054 length:891 start_codon:yes stop_codon:yes gene_type:complete
MKKYLIFGASGFIGGNILKLLPRNIELSLITSHKKQLAQKLKNKKLYPKINFRNYKFINLKNKNFFQDQDIIINCMGAYPNGKNKNLMYKLNYSLPKKIVRLSTSVKPKKFITINTMLKNRKSLYVFYKHKLSDYLKRNKGKTSVIDLYVSHLYGDPLNKKEFIFNILQQINNKEKYINLTKGNQKRDFLHIRDFNNLFTQVLKFKTNKKYNKFEVGNYKSYSIRDVVNLIKKFKKSNIELRFGKIKYKVGEDFVMRCNKKTISKINWSPKINLKKGINLLSKKINTKNYNNFYGL